MIVRQRGAAYFAAGRVELGPPDRGGIRARVRGSSVYDIAIVFKDDGTRWALHCSCPYAEEHVACKHLWAVLLAADDQARLPGAARIVPGRLARAESWPAWKRRLTRLKRQAPVEPEPAPVWPENRRLVYRLDLDSMRATGQVVIDVKLERVSDSSRGTHPFSFTREAWLSAPDELDRQIAHLLLGAQAESSWSQHTLQRRFVIPPPMYGSTLRTICTTARCMAWSGAQPQVGRSVAWDDGPVWQPRLRLLRSGQHWELAGTLTRDAEERAIESALLLTEHGLVLFPGLLGRFNAAAARTMLPLLAEPEPLSVPDEQLFDVVAELLQLPQLPTLDLPPELNLEETRPAPGPRLVIKPTDNYRSTLELRGELSFSYDGHVVAHTQRGRAIVLRDQRRIVYRQPEREQEAYNHLRQLGLRVQRSWNSNRERFSLLARQLPALVETLTAEGWHVEADGKRYRAATQTDLRVDSGIDWFEVSGSAAFGDQRAALPRLLQALRRGEHTVVLDDGTVGILPMEWLHRITNVAALGQISDDETSIRFTRAQTLLLDALLATLEAPRVDAVFAHIREELRRFDAVKPQEPAPSFTGELRPYQKEGLGWMEFLRRFQLGGCLADDMGLGKTVQVLAQLDRRRLEQAGPALVVVPRSLIFNWKEEAARFTPRLRVRDHTGPQRHQEPLDVTTFDVLLTTYGTLRRDAPVLRDIVFDYIVLDEAQAIKNARTASAKAARLLRGTHRLALSGTPVENRMEELWSLFEFLNPGMLGATAAFSELRRASSSNGDSDGPAVLARALRPFLLRRTKEQVAPELPPRVEQTLVIELAADERALYNELREHYRGALLQRIDRIGIKRVRIEILEALLRLRQAACHAALIDPRRKQESSSKLDMLSTQLAEIVAEGHKALVFSQFTSFLALVRARLEADGLTYEYLDGKTRNRQERVQRFQNDPACPIFLISLRAGGHGLNLTAADYVFVLDPWWNPAVEAQAIDRTHRIGQQRPVLAMRLIARDTVEEKVLELQRQKRELADAILGADAGGLASIGREELELLLG